MGSAACLVCSDEPLVLCRSALQHGTKGGPTNGAAPPLRLPPFEIPLLEPLLCLSGSLYAEGGWVCAGQNGCVSCRFI